MRRAIFLLPILPTALFLSALSAQTASKPWTFTSSTSKAETPRCSFRPIANPC
jgi:hypothetical protein